MYALLAFKLNENWLYKLMYKCINENWSLFFFLSKISFLDLIRQGEVGGKSLRTIVGKGKVVEESCVVQLGETSTNIQFSLTSMVGASDTRDVIALDEKNARYEEVNNI